MAGLHIVTENGRKVSFSGVCYTTEQQSNVVSLKLISFFSIQRSNGQGIRIKKIKLYRADGNSSLLEMAKMCDTRGKR